MSHILETPNPFIPGNSFCMSRERFSTTDFPQPNAVCCSVIRLPTSQYKAIISLFTAFNASYWADLIRAVISFLKLRYSGDNIELFFSVIFCMYDN